MAIRSCQLPGCPAEATGPSEPAGRDTGSEDLLPSRRRSRSRSLSVAEAPGKAQAEASEPGDNVHAAVAASALPEPCMSGPDIGDAANCFAEATEVPLLSGVEALERFSIFLGDCGLLAARGALLSEGIGTSKASCDEAALLSAVTCALHSNGVCSNSSRGAMRLSSRPPALIRRLCAPPTVRGTSLELLPTAPPPISLVLS
mmetsp:Transcript_65512/g.142889  ORF Transcript_65512/g.142889 Transcript_65512/m.142889 type:complete len:202 (+) Transcript_65512:243-848(+)